jgi:heat shock protein HslJ
VLLIYMRGDSLQNEEAEMKRKLSVYFTLLALSTLVLMACGGGLGETPEQTLWVGPYTVDCEGVAPQKCLVVKEKPEDDWSLFYDRIEGFEYEEGFLYQLLVSAEEVENPPADASSLRYSLLEIVSQDRSLEGTNWVLDSRLNSKGVLVDVLPGSQISARFQAGELGGSAGCNSYFASYRTRGDGLSITMGGMTEMYCAPEPIMVQEQEYLTTLDKAGTFLITSNKLQIMDLDGNVLLIYSVLENTSLVGTDWQLGGYNNGKGGFTSVLNGTEITAKFGEDGQLGGSSGCNNYSAPYEAEGGAAGGSISVGLVASTMKMCPDPVMEQERAYLGALESAVAWRIEGDTLTMTDAGGTRLLTYIVRRPASLVGTPWQVLRYNNGKGGITSVLLGTEITAAFSPDGSLVGSAGCNNYNASYELEGEAGEANGGIAVGPVATTRKMCPEPEGIMEQEAAYLAALGAAASFQIEGEQLELRDSEGTRMVTYVKLAEPTAPVESPSQSGSTALSDEALRNMEYASEWTKSGVAPLTDGEYREQAAPGSATETVVRLTDHVARGQLNGQDAAAAVLVTDPGGSGTFYDLAVVVERDGKPVNVATASLGDRAQINSLSIVGDEIVVDMVTHGPEDPMCCSTQQVIQTYAMQGDQLVKTSEQVVGSEPE